jgi:hypothetical protein
VAVVATAAEPKTKLPVLSKDNAVEKVIAPLIAPAVVPLRYQT